MQQPNHDKVLQFVQRNQEPFVTTGDLAEEFTDVTDRTLRKRLNDLWQEGKLERRKIGAGARVWYLP